MKYLIVFVLFGCLALDVDASALRKDSGNQQNIDADKEGSGEKDKPVEKILRKRSSDGEDDRQSSSESEKQEEPAKSLVFGFNTGGNQEGKSEAVEKVIEVLKKAMKTVNKEPLFRSKKFDFGDSPQHRSKSSLGFELDTPTLLNWMKKVMSSRRVKKATDDFARKAAIIFRALKDD